MTSFFVNRIKNRKQKKMYYIYPHFNLKLLNIMKRKHYLLTLLLFVLGCKSLFAQSQPEQDCINAIPICQLVYIQSNSYTGTGAVLNEINPAISCLLSGEKNDAWYQLTIQTGGDICFTLTPNAITDDYDWAVFNLTNASCSDIATNAALQVSCNYSGNIGCGGTTGANGGQSGPCGGQNNACIPVLAGQTYVLNVSNFSATQGGYILDFTASTAVLAGGGIPAISNITNPCGNGTFLVNFSKDVLCNSVNPSDFTVTGPGGSYSVVGVNSANCAAGSQTANNFGLQISPVPTQGGTYSVALVGTVLDNCGNLALLDSVSVTVPIIYAIANPDSICIGDTVTLSTTLGANPTGYLFNWSPVMSVQPSLMVVPNAFPATYNVTVAYGGVCSLTSSVTINSLFSPNFDVSISDSAICIGQNANIQLNNPNLYPNVSAFWDFDGGTIASGNGAGPYDINWNTGGTKYISLYLVDSNACASNIYTDSVYVIPQPNVDFTFVGNPCLNQLVDVAYVGNVPATSVPTWNFSAGTNIVSSSGTNPYTLSWNVAGSYSVSLFFTSIEGCLSDTVTHIVNILPKPIFDFNYNTQLCGNIPATLDVISPAPSGTPIWEFSSGNILSGSGLGAYQILWANAGLHPISLYFVDSVGCASDTITHLVETLPFPSPIIIGGDIAQGTNIVPYHFYVLSPLSANYTYQWVVQNGQITGASNLDSVEVIWQNPALNGTIFLTVIDTSGCSNSTMLSIPLYPLALEENIAQNIEIYPNPTEDNFFIVQKTPIPLQEKAYLFNTMGQLVKTISLTGEKTNVEVKDLTSGVYVLRIGNVSKRIVVED
jgi:hypothetical protein